METDDGGPAFPNATDFRETGMTLRDYFAAKCLEGFWASEDEDIGDKEFDQHQAETCKGFYTWADAMLAARNSSESGVDAPP
jgi:hypothetical protein